MCDICVMNAVKDRMLSRRQFFTAGAATAAATALSTAVAPPAMAAGHGQIEDLTHTLDADFPTFGGDPGIALESTYNYADHKFNLLKIALDEHTGTHIDAPLHFSADGQSVDEIPVANLIAPLCVIDIAARAAEDADTQVTPDDLKAWIAANGDIPPHACVAMYSGWGEKVGTDKFRNSDGEVIPDFPSGLMI